MFPELILLSILKYESYQLKFFKIQNFRRAQFLKLFRGFYHECGFAVSSLWAVLIGCEGGHVVVTW